MSFGTPREVPSAKQKQFLEELLQELNPKLQQLNAPTFTLEEWVADSVNRTGPFSKQDYSLAIDRARWQIKRCHKRMWALNDPASAKNRRKS